MNIDATDFLIETEMPENLDKILNDWGAALVGGGMPGGYVKKDGCYVMRVFGDTRFIEFAIKNQRYGEIIKKLDDLI